VKENSPEQSESASDALGSMPRNTLPFPAKPGERSEYISSSICRSRFALFGDIADNYDQKAADFLKSIIPPAD